MPFTLTLPRDIEQALRERAQARGVTLIALAEDILSREAESAPEPREDQSGPESADPGPRSSKLLQVCAMVRGQTDDADFSRNPSTGDRTGQSLIDACAKVRGLLTDEEVDTLFARSPPGSPEAKDLVELFENSPFKGLDMTFERDPDCGRDIVLMGEEEQA